MVSNVEEVISTTLLLEKQTGKNWDHLRVVVQSPEEAKQLAQEIANRWNKNTRVIEVRHVVVFVATPE